MQPSLPWALCWGCLCVPWVNCTRPLFKEDKKTDAASLEGDKGPVNEVMATWHSGPPVLPPPCIVRKDPRPHRPPRQASTPAPWHTGLWSRPLCLP